MRFFLCALALVAACGGSDSTNPAGGSSGLPNQTGTSSSGSSGTSSGGTKKDGGNPAGDDDDDTTKPDAGKPPPSGPANVRIMAANISSGTKQSYDPGEGIRIFQGVKPDIVMIQEFNYGTKSEVDIRAFVDKAFGAEFEYFRETGNIPNGVISKYPITESGHFDSGAPDRGFAWAKIAVPGTHPLYAFSVHLRTTSPSVRKGEADILLAKIQGLVAADDFVAIGGDFNSDNRSEACLTTLNAVVDATNSHAADNNGNENTNANRGKPYDWMLASPNLVTHQVATTIGASSFDKGLVFDSRVYTPLAEVSPVQKNDSGAEAMQHMAIVKDFYLE